MLSAGASSAEYHTTVPSSPLRGRRRPTALPATGTSRARRPRDRERGAESERSDMAPLGERSGPLRKRRTGREGAASNDPAEVPMTERAQSRRFSVFAGTMADMTYPELEQAGQRGRRRALGAWRHRAARSALSAGDRRVRPVGHARGSAPAACRTRDPERHRAAVLLGRERRERVVPGVVRGAPRGDDRADERRLRRLQKGRLPAGVLPLRTRGSARTTRRSSPA